MVGRGKLHLPIPGNHRLKAENIVGGIPEIGASYALGLAGALGVLVGIPALVRGDSDEVFGYLGGGLVALALGASLYKKGMEKEQAIDQHLTEKEARLKSSRSFQPSDLS